MRATTERRLRSNAAGLVTRYMRASFVAASGLAFALLVATTPARADTKWPSALSYTVGVSTDDSARVQTSAFVYGPLDGGFGAKVGGWWVTGGSDNRAFLGDTYLDYQKGPVYLAGGRKFVPFGPAGILVSPGIYGGEARLECDRVTVQAISGSLAFTSVTGGTRFTFAGSSSPADQHVAAARVAVQFTQPNSETPVTIGGNVLHLLDKSGRSGDVSIGANECVSFFGEAAQFAGVHASAYGVRWSNQKTQRDPSRFTLAVLYHRRVPVGFEPAAVGATQYFEDQTGWAGGIYHQFQPRRAVGLYADKDNAILTLFGYVPL